MDLFNLSSKPGLNGVNQTTINNTEEIFAKICEELRSAKSEIQVAMAWFTDPDIFNIVKEKAAQGTVRVELIIADNEDNRKLPFVELLGRNSSVYVVKNAGYGTMHHKFCIIDRSRVMQGSYNWTVNARRNNAESMTITDFPKTVEEHIRIFEDTKRGLPLWNETGISQPTSTTVVPDGRSQRSVEAIDKVDRSPQFSDVLSALIDSELPRLDREALRKEGYERAQENNGDHQILKGSLNSLLSCAVDQITIVEEARNRILTKIEQYKLQEIESIETQCNAMVKAKEETMLLTKGIKESENVRKTMEIEGLKAEIKNLEEGKIATLKAKADAFRTEIKTLKESIVLPKFNWAKFIPVALLTSGLLCYLFMFYSSAAYILLFSEADALEAKLNNVTIVVPEVFMPDAVTLADGLGGKAFVILFVFLPLTFSLSNQLIKNAWGSWSTFLIGAILIDGFLAFKVAQSIHNVKFLAGKTLVPWDIGMLWKNDNFYLVFVLGAFGLFMFKFVFSSFLEIFDERKPDVVQARVNEKVKAIAEEMSKTESEIAESVAQINSISAKILGMKADLERNNREMDQLPLQWASEKQVIEADRLRRINHVRGVAQVHAGHVESDRVPLSAHAVRDRVNLFVEGWCGFLHARYAIQVAIGMSESAVAEVNQWLNEHLEFIEVKKTW